MALLLLQCWQAGALAASLPPSPGSAQPPLISGVGRWNLRALGSEQVSLSPDSSDTSRGILFRVPPGEGNRQRGIEETEDSAPPGSFTVAPPKGMSYLIHMDVLARLAPDTGPGSISITGQTNGYNATEVSIRVKRDGDGGLRARWSTYDLLVGGRSGSVGDGPVRIRTENYTQFNSVVPGSNFLTFNVESFGRARLAEATVLADSGLTTTWLKPARLKLSVRPRDGGEMVLGKAVGVDFTVANVGDRVARDVRVSLRPLSKKASLLGRKQYLFDEVSAAKSGTFFIMPKREGEVRFEFVANSANANNPGGFLDGDIGSGDPSVPAPPWLLAALISGLVILGWRRWRSRRRRLG